MTRAQHKAIQQIASAIIEELDEVIGERIDDTSELNPGDMDDMDDMDEVFKAIRKAIKAKL